jgi:hypothetical protein
MINTYSFYLPWLFFLSLQQLMHLFSFVNVLLFKSKMSNYCEMIVYMCEVLKFIPFLLLCDCFTKLYDGQGCVSRSMQRDSRCCCRRGYRFLFSKPIHSLITIVKVRDSNVLFVQRPINKRWPTRKSWERNSVWRAVNDR